MQNSNSGSGKLVYEAYTYNNFNQLTRYTGNGSTATYSYRADGLRYEKTVNGTTTYFGWQGDNIVTEYNKSGAVTNNYTRGLNLIKNSNSEYYVFDAHNDVIQLTNSSGTVTKDYTYDAFGNESDISDSDTNPFRYCGQYYDDETGFIYLRARYYNPATGSFTTEDPAFDGVNWYSYCGGNPVMYVDPSGYIEEEEIEKFKSGEISPGAYTYLWHCTNQYLLSDTDSDREYWHNKAEEFRATGYTDAGDEEWNSIISYMDSLPTGKLNEDEHYFRNKLNLEYSYDDFCKLQERLPAKYMWLPCSEDDAAFHNIGVDPDTPNVKYISFDGHFELVYTYDGKLVNEASDPMNMGTYNYYSYKTDKLSHIFEDIFPYMDYTNTAATNTEENRAIIKKISYEQIGNQFFDLVFNATDVY